MEKDTLKKIKKVRGKHNKKAIVISIAIVIIVLIIFFGSLIFLGLYKLDWQDQNMEKITKLVPLPVAKVNNAYLLFSDYLANLRALNQFYQIQKDTGLPIVPSELEIKKKVIEERMITNYLVRIIAQRYNVSVSQTEIEAEINQIIENKGSQKEFEDFLSDFYNISIGEYIKYFTVPNLYYDKTNQAIANDQGLNNQAREEINAAYQELESGQDFSEVAKKYSQDPSSESGGLIRSYSRGDLPKYLEDQLYALNQGEYTDIITIENSLQIIQLVKKDQENGVLVLKIILTKITSLEDLIEQERNKADIKIFVY